MVCFKLGDWVSTLLTCEKNTTIVTDPHNQMGSDKFAKRTSCYKKKILEAHLGTCEKNTNLTRLPYSKPNKKKYLLKQL